MRPIWSGTIQFGLVTIPVGVYSATSSERISFNMLHKKDHGRIRNKKFCEIEGKEVSNDDIIKGFEYEKGEYIEMTEKDFESIAVESTKVINITDFVSHADIDPMFFDTPYYLAPGKGADQTYLLLREAMKKSGKVGIAKVSIRQREYLAAVKPHKAALMLETMHFADEITDPEELKLPAEGAKIDSRQLKIAEQLITGLSGKFNPEQYKDTYREALLKVIDDKLKGKTISKPAAAFTAQSTKVVDIMEKLKESLKVVAKQKTTTTKPKAVARKKSSKTRAA